MKSADDIMKASALGKAIVAAALQELSNKGLACKAGTAAMQNVKAMVDADFIEYGMAIGSGT